MNSPEERMAALEAKVESIDRRASERSDVEKKLLEAARQWARLTKLGHYVENQSDRPYRERPRGEALASLIRMFEIHIRYYSEELIILETT